jgi:hypothetical protein
MVINCGAPGGPNWDQPLNKNQRKNRKRREREREEQRVERVALQMKALVNEKFFCERSFFC